MNPNTWSQITKSQNFPLDNQSLLDLSKLNPKLPKNTSAKIRKQLKLIAKSQQPNSIIQLLRYLQPHQQWIEHQQCTPIHIPKLKASITPTTTDSNSSPSFITLFEPLANKLDSPDYSLPIRSSPNNRIQQILQHTHTHFGLLANSNTLRILIDNHKSDPASIQWPIKHLIENSQQLNAFSSILNLTLKNPKQLLNQQNTHSTNQSKKLRAQIQTAFKLLFKSFCQDFDQSPVPTIQKKAQNTDNHKLHEMLLVILMRILFLIYAEQKNLLPIHQHFYRHSYSLQSIWLSLNSPPNPSFPHFSTDAWLQFLANSKLLFQGCHHPSLNLIPYGGELFNPNRFPLLSEWKLRNADFHQALKPLLQSHNQQPIPLKNFDVEQMGYLYEGLLEIEISGPTKQRTINPSSSKRNSGTFYTPRELTKPLVEKTLQPLLYNKKRLLISPRDILALKICDLTAGSGAVLVQITRYLSQKLLQAWQIQIKKISNSAIPTLPYAEPMKDPLNQSPLPLDDPQEMLIQARRLIVQRCLYGVDINPLAIEIARLSLWILSLSKHKPFSFVDHSLKSGNSLLSVDIQQLQNWSLKPKFNPTPLLQQLTKKRVAITLRKRRKITSINLQTPDDLAFKQQTLNEANKAIHKLKLASDLLLSTSIQDPIHITDALSQFTSAKTNEQWMAIKQRTKQAPRSLEQPFHWQLEFPEVLLDPNNPGFNAIIANPPFMGGQKISNELGYKLREYLVNHVADGIKGSADLSAYFLKKAYSLLANNGKLGIIITNSISSGASKTVALEPILKQHATIYEANTNTPWPGTANLHITTLHITKGPYTQPKLLNGQPCSHISAALDKIELPTPKTLPKQLGLSFQGSIPLGQNFIIHPKLATQWLLQNPKLQKVLFPYLTGHDLNQNQSLTPSRWIINFHDWPMHKAQLYQPAFKHLEDHLKNARRTSKSKRLREIWWQHCAQRKTLYRAISNLKQVLVRSRISNRHILSFVPNSWIFADGITIFATQDHSALSLLQSSIHEIWARRYSSSLRNDMRYCSTTAFETFPWPKQQHKLWTQLSDLAQLLQKQRLQALQNSNYGLQKIYNAIHDPNNQQPQIQTLRETHTKIDRAVLQCYQWNDLISPQSHSFQFDNKHRRFNLNPKLQNEILHRLSKLNQQQHSLQTTKK
jgi:type I restriction-modification system DNA methylase subunit